MIFLKKIIMTQSLQTVGILGGGQLGRMMVEAAQRLNINTVVLDNDGCCAQGPRVNGSFRDPLKIKELASKADILTIEIEHVNADALLNISIPVQPDAETILLIQNKFNQKQHLNSIPRSPFKDVKTKDDILNAGLEYGYPLMLKAKLSAYDGKGNKVVFQESEIESAMEILGGQNLYVEKFVRFEKELSVMVAKSVNGQIKSYPCVETIQKDNICHLVIAPAQIEASIQKKAQNIAEAVVSSFKGCGIYGVELFMLKNGSDYLIKVI